MLAHLILHDLRAAHLLIPDHLITNPAVPVAQSHDSSGNRVSRIIAPAGQIRLTRNALTSARRRTMSPAPSSTKARICLPKRFVSSSARATA
jgi:hypothetical protein